MKAKDALANATYTLTCSGCGNSYYSKEAFPNHPYCKTCMRTFKAGVKEVVEFINYLIIGVEGCTFEERLDGDKGCLVLGMNQNQWNEQLKEWGMEK